MTTDDIDKMFQYAISKLFERVRERTIEIKCVHEWKEYIGFTERYKYCAKCDSKENQ